MPTPVGELLVAALAAAGLSQHAFCRAVGYDQGSLQGVIKGKRSPPRGSERAWADALGLRGAARHEFLVSYWLAHSPPDLAAEIDRLRAAIDRK
jgi:transcriptional regulator with XRE-family HTH domain